jgi:hypothetical protein
VIHTSASTLGRCRLTHVSQDGKSYSRRLFQAGAFAWIVSSPSAHAGRVRIMLLAAIILRYLGSTPAIAEASAHEPTFSAPRRSGGFTRSKSESERFSGPERRVAYEIERRSSY